VLGLVIARALYDGYPEFSEGQLAKARAHIVSRRSCAIVAKGLGLGERLIERAREDFSEDAEQLARNRNVLAALLEAALAALLLEHGYESIEPAVVEAFRDRIEYALTTYVDHKTELQEALARRGQQVVYTVVAAEGPPHERMFTTAATVDGEQVGTGQGASKKEAEQAAAKEALASFVRSDD
jgi:ribonuclease III